ncbi:hypothetical protein WDJ51_12620 [Rathayibacter sp. YIM 133350]|uniref:hypothetical protein n=1 Tax=Rathayibacter sp. YIM 133350 TaxID=3131992 RepID=UPI00307E185A
MVMQREVPAADLYRLMWRMWGQGFSSRPCPQQAPREGWVVLEFWIETRSVDGDGLAAFEIELDDLLIRVMGIPIAGRGARAEIA